MSYRQYGTMQLSLSQSHGYYYHTRSSLCFSFELDNGLPHCGSTLHMSGPTKGSYLANFLDLGHPPSWSNLYMDPLFFST